jgi:hypothetical protein
MFKVVGVILIASLIIILLLYLAEIISQGLLAVTQLALFIFFLGLIAVNEYKTRSKK